MTEQPLLRPEIPHGIRTESAWKIRPPRARTRAIPYRTRTGTRARLRVRAYRPSFYNQLVQRAARAVSAFVNTPHAKTQASTIARVVHTLLATEHFDSLADLTDALKWRLAQLRIRWTPDDLNDAYRLVKTARPLLSAPPPHTTVHAEREPDRTVSRAEAAAILNRLGIQL